MFSKSGFHKNENKRKPLIFRINGLRLYSDKSRWNLNVAA